MNQRPIKPEPPLNMSIAERENLIARHQAASTDTRLSPLSQATATKTVQQLRWIQHKRIQQLCAALGANCETPAIHRADEPANEHEVAIDRAWDVLISATAKKLGWEGEPASRAMGRKAHSIRDGAERAELYRKAGLIRALEVHRPSPLDDGTIYSAFKRDTDAAGITITPQQAQQVVLPLDVATQPAGQPQAQASTAEVAPPATAAPPENMPVQSAPTAPAGVPVDLFHTRAADASRSLPTPAEPITASAAVARPTTGGGTQAAIEMAWDDAIVSAAKNLGWQGEPTSRAMNLKALLMPKGPERTDLYRKATLIKALEDHRDKVGAAPLTTIKGDGETKVLEPASVARGSADEHQAAIDKAWDTLIAAQAKSLGWEGEPTSYAMALAALHTPKGTANTELWRKAALIKMLEEQRAAAFRSGTAPDAQPHQTNQPEAIPMKKTWQWPTVRTAAIIAVMLAVAGFGFVTYRPQFSLLTNIMIDRIEFDPQCIPTRASNYTMYPNPCGDYVSYRWVLSVLGVFVGVAALKHRRT